MAEFDRARIAAVLAADAQFNVGTGLLAEIGSHFYKLADTLLVELFKLIVLVNLLILISAE